MHIALTYISQHTLDEIYMAKDAAISLRVEPELKAALEAEATKEGRALAAYVERVLRLHHVGPLWLLRDCQPLNRKGSGPQVGLTIADGWPAAILSASRAEELGHQLIAAAKLAKGLTPAE
jgi:hypothetical protein